MKNKALVVIDIQNDITKNYMDVIDNINRALAWALDNSIDVVYIKHNNLTAGTRTFKPNTKGEKFAPELNVVSNNIFTKSKGNALTSEEFVEYIRTKEIQEFFIAGADATACIKSTCYNMSKSGYTVTVLSDCITSYDRGRIGEMLKYYESRNCNLSTIAQLL